MFWFNSHKKESRATEYWSSEQDEYALPPMQGDAARKAMAVPTEERFEPHGTGFMSARSRLLDNVAARLGDNPRFSTPTPSTDKPRNYRTSSATSTVPCPPLPPPSTSPIGSRASTPSLIASLPNPPLTTKKQFKAKVCSAARHSPISDNGTMLDSSTQKVRPHTDPSHRRSLSSPPPNARALTHSGATPSPFQIAINKKRYISIGFRSIRTHTPR